MSSLVNICFHGIGTPKRALEPGEDRYWITQDSYQRILDEVAGWPSVRLSFDDGNASDVEAGLPGLLERELQATFFLIADRTDTPGSLGRSEIHELTAAGMSIGTHGMTHRPWRGLSAEQSRDELVTAREQLADLVGSPVNEAALPLGRYDRRLLTELRRLGYTRVFSSDRRKTQAHKWFQPRFSVTGVDTPESLRAAALVGPGLAGRLKLSAKGRLKRLR